MNKPLDIVLALALTGLLAGCSTVALQPGADAIKVTQDTHLPRGCRFVGQVMNEDRNGVTQSYQSHAHLQIDQLNTLKNTALKQGANVVVITEHQTTYVNPTQSDNYRMPAYKGVGTHRLAGKSYRCDARALSRLTPAHNLSDVKTNEE